MEVGKIGIVLSQAKECLGTQEAGKGKGGLFLEPWGAVWP